MVFAIANAVVEDHNETTGCLFQEATQMVKCLDAISFPGWHDWNTEFGVSLGGPVSLRKFRIFSMEMVHFGAFSYTMEQGLNESVLCTQV